MIDRNEERFISVFTSMEMVQGAHSKKSVYLAKSFLNDLNFIVLPLTENIGHRALIYLEEYALTSGLHAGDSLIAATAVENNLTLATGNHKHFQAIKDLSLHHFKA